MPKLTQLEDLQAAIRLAATDSESRIPSAVVAAEFYADHRELVALVADQWVLEKLTKLIRQHRASVRRQNNHQLVLEGMFGFRRLPAKIEVRPGKSVRRADAKISHFRKLVARLRREKSPALVDALSAVELLQRYSNRGGTPVTWSEALELESQRSRKKV